MIADDHHPPPTFTPPELPKKVHVKGILQKNSILLQPLDTVA